LANSESTGGVYSDSSHNVSRFCDSLPVYVLDGELTFICDGKKTVLGTDYSSKKDSRVLIHVMPGGKVGFVGTMLEMAMPVRKGASPESTPPGVQRLKTLCEKNQIDILGPLPE
jgi:hypothetical protein